MQATTMKQKQQQVGALRGSLILEKEEDLALFLEVRRREKERNDNLEKKSQEFGSLFGSKPGTIPVFNLSASTKLSARRMAADDFLNSENGKNDYDWLITPPVTPLFPSIEMESQKTLMSQLGTPKARPTVLKSRFTTPQIEPIARGNSVSKQLASPPGMHSSTGARGPSSSGGPVSRSVTPTRQPTLTNESKVSRLSTPTSRTAAPSLKSTISSAKPLVSATKQTVPSTKSSVPSRSSTPISRSTGRSSTPTSRPIISAPKSTSRASTPTRRPSTPSSASNVSVITAKSSSSVSKPSPTTTKNPALSRGSSPTVRSRPWNPAEMPGFSLDAPPNLRTSLPERPLSATRGRPGAPSARSSSVEPVPNGRPRRQSCSPSRGRAALSGAIHLSGSSVPAVSRGYSKVKDSMNPVVIGTKMVERVINMRRLAPPKQDDKNSPHSNLSGKSSSPDTSGFGRTLSKKSLDMAIRHMDIRRSLAGNLRPLMTKIPASSMYSVRSGSTHSRTISVSDSPLATSSNASSELSVNNNGVSVDKNLVDEDVGSERGDLSPASVHGR